MYPENRPLETLTTYAVTFAAGMLTSLALSAYTSWVQYRATEEAEAKANGTHRLVD